MIYVLNGIPNTIFEVKWHRVELAGCIEANLIHLPVVVVYRPIFCPLSWEYKLIHTGYESGMTVAQSFALIVLMYLFLAILLLC